MTVVREQGRIFRIFAADRKAQHFGQQSALLINPVDNHGVVACIRADKIAEILGQIQSTGGGHIGVIIIQRGDLLDFFKFRFAVLVPL